MSSIIMCAYFVSSENCTHVVWWVTEDKPLTQCMNVAILALTRSLLLTLSYTTETFSTNWCTSSILMYRLVAVTLFAIGYAWNYPILVQHPAVLTNILNSFVPAKGQIICAAKRVKCLSLKKGIKYLSLRKDKLFVPQKWQSVCSSKRAKQLSLKNSKVIFPEKGQSDCPPKRSKCLSLKKGKAFVSQKGK